MQIKPSKLKTFLELNNSFESLVNKFANIFRLTESRSPGSSLRSQTHKNKHLRFNMDDLELVNIGLFSHDIMRNQEYLLLKKNLNSFDRPILDLGCGDGQFATLLFDKLDAGVDLSEASIKAARKLNIYENLNVADCTKRIPHPDNSFKTVYSNSVMEHIPDIEGVIKEVSRTLESGGKFIITTYGDNFLPELSKSVGKSIAETYNSKITHVSLYGIPYWSDLLIKYDLKISKVVPYLSIDALIQMVIYSSSIFKIPQILFPKLFWSLTKNKLYNIVQPSMNIESGLGFLLVATKK
tara:strand:- start:2619 stop:3506 length:888 start_codon:yes stop_codon:yes gene_type:complete